MKRFLSKIIIYALLAFAVTAVVNYAYIRLDGSDPDHTAKFESIPSSIQVCNFGSSHGLYDFDYEALYGTSCFNFALEAQLPSYDERLFEYYKDRIAENAVAFIPVSYFSLFGIDEREENNFAERNRRYYRILPETLIKDYDVKTDIYVNYLPSLLAGKKLFTVLAGKSKNTNEELWNRTITPDEAEKDAGRAYEKHLVLGKLDAEGNRIVNQGEVTALINLIDGCNSRGITPVLVTTPFLREYTDVIMEEAPDFLGEFYSLIDEIRGRTGVVYLDYSFDERFRDRYDWFMNVDHMNKEGAGHFVDILLKDSKKACRINIPLV